MKEGYIKRKTSTIDERAEGSVLTGFSSEAEAISLAGCSLRQGAGGTEFARLGSRTCFFEVIL